MIAYNNYSTLAWSEPLSLENVVIYHPSVRTHHRVTNVYSHFLASFGAQEKTDCT